MIGTPDEVTRAEMTRSWMAAKIARRIAEICTLRSMALLRGKDPDVFGDPDELAFFRDALHCDEAGWWTSIGHGETMKDLYRSRTLLRTRERRFGQPKARGSRAAIAVTVFCASWAGTLDELMRQLLRDWIAGDEAAGQVTLDLAESRGMGC